MLDKNTFLTVIVTVFNVEQHLRKCIESIMRQTYKAIEIILVDDGSNDMSGKICDHYAEQDNRIKVYHKKNAGVVSARKIGVDFASGGIVAFVDGDDWIEPDMYQCMMEEWASNELDMLTSGIIYEWENKTELVLDGAEEGIYEKKAIYEEIMPYMSYNMRLGVAGITASVCNKLFKTSLLKRVLSSIDIELTHGEDGAITYLYVAQTNKLKVIRRSWYHYVQHENSAIRQNSLDSFEKIYRLEQNLMNGFAELGIASKMKQQVMYYIKPYLHNAVKKVYGIDLHAVSFVFPYEDIPKGSRIILYGAGQVGQAYYKCIKRGRYAVLNAWVDADYKNLQTEGFPVESPEIIKNTEYDYLVVAVADSDVFTEICNALLKAGVNKEKIVWKSDNRIVL